MAQCSNNKTTVFINKIKSFTTPVLYQLNDEVEFTLTSLFYVMQQFFALIVTQNVRTRSPSNFFLILHST